MAQRSTKQRTGLFLDGSGFIGWSLMAFAPSVPLLRYDTFKVPRMADPAIFGPRWAIIQKWLNDMVDRHKPDVIGFESPFVPVYGNKAGQGYVNINTLRFLLGVCTIFETVASQRGLECKEVANGSAKKALGGHGRADVKTMQAAAFARGWEVANDHEADACAVGLVIVTQYLKRYGLEAEASKGKS
jgi:Holliday junction resolvasome RuvABC endonuclease subunit